jgi:hypothetical protein
MYECGCLLKKAHRELPKKKKIESKTTRGKKAHNREQREQTKTRKRLKKAQTETRPEMVKKSFWRRLLFFPSSEKARANERVRVRKNKK